MEKKYVNYIQNERDCSEAQNNEGKPKILPQFYIHTSILSGNFASKQMENIP
jgi:hypothetical protein